MTTHTINTEAVFQAYVECALWSSSVEEDYAAANDMASDVSLQSAGFGPEDLAANALDAMRADVSDFLRGAPVDALEFWAAELSETAIGHDFWLTRNGHGTGFWDRFYHGEGATYGRALSEMSKPYGESHLYIGDDELVYVG